MKGTFTPNDSYRLDHVILGVKDLKAAAATLKQSYGFTAMPGGVHPTGTANMVIPMTPPQYIELLAINDPATATKDRAASALAAEIAKGDGLVGWAIEVSDIDAISERTGIRPVGGSIQLKDGTRGGWRLMIHPDLSLRHLPFFIAYEGDSEVRMSRWKSRFVDADHDVEPWRFSWIELSGDRHTFADWVGDLDLPVRWSDGADKIQGVGIATSSGEVILR